MTTNLIANSKTLYSKRTWNLVVLESRQYAVKKSVQEMLWLYELTGKRMVKFHSDEGQKLGDCSSHVAVGGKSRQNTLEEQEE